jgi:IS30 family transposase
MSEHQRLTALTGVPVFFADPHSPWQRGSNENANGLLRQYLPKGTDLAGHSQAALDAIAGKLNNRPRKTHGFRTPLQVYHDLLAQAEGQVAAAVSIHGVTRPGDFQAGVTAECGRDDRWGV